MGRNLTALAVAAIAVAVAACSGNGTTASSNQSLPMVKRGHPSTPPPYTFTFQPVDFTKGGSDSRITAIDERPVGVVGVNGTTPNTYSSWSAHTPFPNTTGYREFRTKNYPGAVGTYMSATTSSTFYQGGTVFSPPPNSNLQCTTCGIVHYNKGSGTGYNSGCGVTGCLWTFIQDPSEGTGNCAVTEVSGIANSGLVVGYYLQGASNCGSQAFEATYGPTGAVFADFDVPGADPNTTQATGVNEKGQTVGTALFNGAPEGWYYDDALYSTKLAVPGSTGTYPMGVNWEAQVVGYYTDYQQNTHGFMLLNPAAPPSEQIWETIDDPLADNYTVVSHINTHHYITGWYKDSNGHLHGFVGTCISSNC